MDFISHCIKKSPWKLKGQSAIGMLIILLVVSLLGWIYLTQASFVATTSRRVQELETEKALLQERNLELMAEIAEWESVTRLATKARQLGFVSSTTQDNQFLAIHDMPSEQTVAQEPTEADWWARVASQFTSWAQSEGQ